jgi:eukaryotic-like serine/threonine-protein kinase
MATLDASTSFSFSDADMPVRFGRYLLIKRQSSDPIGEEFLAAWGVDEGVDQIRTVRGIYPAIAQESQFVGLFAEEARALSRLANSNVVRVMEVATESGIPFVASEHVEGVTLARLIELAEVRKALCPWELAAHIAAELLRGLDYVHRREDLHGSPMKMRHGDVRPANVLVSYQGEVKLSNFGSSLGFIVDEHTNARLKTFRGIFAPPEGREDSMEASVKGDLWGVSAILWTLLAGHNMLSSVQAKEGHWTLPSIADRVEAMPPVLDAYMARALNPDQDYRYETAGEMREELLAIISEHATGHPPDDLAAWVRDLGEKDRLEEEEFIRTMLGRQASMTLDETATASRIGPGTVIDGRYHLQILLGEGGMGQVYEAEHLGIGRRVAIKVLHERVLDDEVTIERFRREARITGSLGHPNIVGAYDFGETSEGHHYLAMDLLEGESLSARIKRDGVMPARELVGIMAQVCSGLEAAHVAGVVHRDLKPENIFLTAQGPKIVDFGIAKRSGFEDTEQSLTRTGHICGTVEYVAPEQVRGMDPDYKCDIYAMGIMIYEALTGETPFRGRNIGETLHKVMNDRVVPPRKRTGDRTIPKELEAICLRAISRVAARRYGSAAEMGAALLKIVPSEVTDSTVDLPVGNQGRNRFYAAGGVIVLAILAILVLVFLGGRSGAPDYSVVVPTGTKEKVETVSVKRVSPTDATPRVVPIEDTHKMPQPEKTPSVAKKDVKTERLQSRETVRALLKEGDAAFGKMNMAEARRLYRQAAEIDPRVSQTWYSLGKVAFELGDVPEAKRLIRRALKLSPGRFHWRIFLGKMLMASGDREAAIEEWKRVRKTRPENEEVGRLLSEAGV